jgi:hypothetical protein
MGRAHDGDDRLVEGANTSRAAVVHARTLEVLESLGVSARLASLGLHARRFTIRDRDRVLVSIDFDSLPTRYPYTLMVSQAVTERVLLQRLVELGGHVSRPHALADLAQDPEGVTATLDDGTMLRGDVGELVRIARPRVDTEQASQPTAVFVAGHLRERVGRGQAAGRRRRRLPQRPLISLRVSAP